MLAVLLIQRTEDGGVPIGFGQHGHGAIPWPPLDGLITDLISLHTGRPAAEIEALLPEGEGASGPAGLRGT